MLGPSLHMQKKIEYPPPLGYIFVHTNKMSSDKLRRQNLIFIYEERPVSSEAQTDLDRA